ncbi:winged helix-turn-helix domain-containing protein [Pseudomonas turukhanskensis]|uniref:winged helix-turn-helix domain-containing protein n=1 Tax=Pseudomonas turukhanskensis TaxID=1806536 RepID=UPI0022F2A81A|nr:winged helix-turn-helix domain-containing protein [Pseudomonas turukhanskensis]
MTIRRLLLALIEDGLRQHEIAEHVGVSQPTIHRALKGASVLYETGKAIEQLAAARGCGQESFLVEVDANDIDAPRSEVVRQ